MFRRASLLSVLAVALAAGPAWAEERREHHKIWTALHELREARVELHSSKSDYRGQKKEALAAIDDAIVTLKLVLGIKGDKFDRFDRDKEHYRKHKDHPHLRSVLHDLREARAEIRETKSDLRGHKRRALKDIAYAIDEIEELLRRHR
jgi:hypothetical protein